MHLIAASLHHAEDQELTFSIMITLTYEARLASHRPKRFCLIKLDTTILNLGIKQEIVLEYFEILKY